MTRRQALLAVVVGTTMVAVAPASVARADGSVTLEASPAVAAYGGSITLAGAISPPAAGETVAILAADGVTLTQATTDTAGAFTASVTPTRNVTIHAVWQSASSAPVDIGVRAVLTVRLSDVRLFGTAVVRGTVAPPHPGEPVTVVLTRVGRAVARRNPVMDEAGGFETSFRITVPGTYRVRATFGDDDHLKGSRSDAGATPLSSPPTLHVGSRGRYVKALEQRLVDLNYRLVGVNDVFDFRTADAVMAFTKVQRMTRRSTVDAAVWRSLADPVRPSARSNTHGLHIEVDQTRQVLFTVEDGGITNILHVSTGAGGATHDGSFHVFRKLAGFSGNHLYYPSYFDGLRAIHGWTEVPSYPASHGCVRVPYWNAQWIFGLAALGTPVFVYH